MRPTRNQFHFLTRSSAGRPTARALPVLCFLLVTMMTKPTTTVVQGWTNPLPFSADLYRRHGRRCSLQKLSATTGESENDTEDSSSKTDADITATRDDQNDNDGSVDYPSFQDIDFTELDPLYGLTFEEFQQNYLNNPDTPQDELVWDDSVPTLNQIYVVGRVGNAPEARYLPDNNVVVSLSLALPRYYNYWEREDLQIDYGKEETEWFNCEVWGQTAEFVIKNVEKGTRVGVIGSIDTDYYENKNTGKLSTNLKVS